MSQYIVSARKYRPDSFETLIGQDNIARTLKNSILRGQLAHAYLFCGPRGVGKTSTARIFAKTINCSSPLEDMEPCGHCESCESFQEGRSYCIHELDAASNNGVDDIKALMDQVQIPPQVGKYSVYIIDEVHMLSQAAFNAFLKTLEEPPAHAIFILCTTEKHKIIPTILSRCQTYDFNRISITDMVKNLRGIAEKENVVIDDESLHVIAQKADGAMRDALTIFDQTVAFCGSDIKYADVIRNLNVLDSEYGFRLVDAFLAGDYATALLTFDEILSKGFNALHFISAIGGHMRDLLVARTGGLESLLDLPDSLKRKYREQASRCSVKFLYEAIGITTKCEAGYRASTNQRLHIEYALMRLSFLSSEPSQTAAAPAPQPVKVQQPVQASQPVAAPQPAPQPAPQLAPQPQPETAPALPQRVVKTGAALSMSAFMAAPAEPEKKEVEKAEEKPLPSDEDIVAVWKKLAGETSQPRLANALMNAKLEITEEEGVKKLTFAVTNEAQKKWIEEKVLYAHENRMRAVLGTDKVKLYVTVIPAEEQEVRIYMPQEKAQDLMKRNPEVNELVKDLGLDIK